MPIKRSQELTPLSHDHHTGLVFARSLQAGVQKKADAAVMTNHINWFWENHLQQHFEDEEKWLFSQIENEGVRRAKEEHKQLLQLIGKNNLQNSIEVIAEIADLLKAHIRFEERELFPLLETLLAIDTLHQIGEKLKASHMDVCNSSFAPAYWK